MIFLPQCEPGLGALVMYDLLYQDPTKLMLLAGCSTVCTTVAEAAKMWNLVVVRLRVHYVTWYSMRLGDKFNTIREPNASRLISKTFLD